MGATLLLFLTYKIFPIQKSDPLPCHLQSGLSCPLTCIALPRVKHRREHQTYGWLDGLFTSAVVVEGIS